MKRFTLLFFAVLGLFQTSFACEEKDKKEQALVVSGSSEDSDEACQTSCCETTQTEN